MFLSALLWGLVAGLIHFAVTGALYGNPIVDSIYQKAMKEEPGVKDWPSRARYLITQVSGTQVEIWILALAYLWLRPLIGIEGLGGTLLLGLVFSGIRVYPRFWNMWIQSTYPNRMLAIEFVNGVISTYTVVLALHFLA
jgi:hypothetical protein